MQADTSCRQATPQSQETESLVRRLAGPSSGKAGSVLRNFVQDMSYKLSFRLSKDQSEINRIIADVSKGSKFYEVRLVYESPDTF